MLYFDKKKLSMFSKLWNSSESTNPKNVVQHWVSYTKLSSNGADDKNCLIDLISESLQYP